MPKKSDCETECAIYLDNLFNKQFHKFKNGIKYNQLVKQMIITYSVSSWFVDHHIKRFYIDEGLVSLKDNILMSVEEKNGNIKKK